MHQHLRRLVPLGVIAVVPGVEDMVLPFPFKHRSCEYELILLVVPAARHGYTAILVMHEIRGCGQIPAERFAEWFRIAIVSLVIQKELVALAERHAIAEPRARELVVQLWHDYHSYMVG